MVNLGSSDILYTGLSTVLMGQLAYLGYQELNRLDDKYFWRARCARAYRVLVAGRPSESEEETDPNSGH